MLRMGRELGQAEIVRNMFTGGLDINKIAELTRLNLDEVAEYLRQ